MSIASTITDLGIDTDLFRQPVELVASGLDSLPIDLPDIDARAVAESVGDTATSIALSGGRGVAALFRAIRRHPRISGVGLAMVVTAIATTLLINRKGADDTSEHTLRVAA